MLFEPSGFDCIAILNNNKKKRKRKKLQQCACAVIMFNYDRNKIKEKVNVILTTKLVSLQKYYDDTFGEPSETRRKKNNIKFEFTKRTIIEKIEVKYWSASNENVPSNTGKTRSSCACTKYHPGIFSPFIHSGPSCSKLTKSSVNVSLKL